MGHIYKAPKEIQKPKYDYENWKESEKKDRAYEQQIVDWAKKNGNCPEAGEIVHFPVADGAAQYVVFALKPVKLIHVDTGDAYQFNYAHRLTATDIRKQIQSHKAMAALFSKK